MPMECDHHSRMDGTCVLAWVREDEDGNIIEWDTEGYAIDEQGQCMADGSDYPGDECESYQPDLAGEYCTRCGEYLGENPDDEDDETKECYCDA